MTINDPTVSEAIRDARGPRPVASLDRKRGRPAQQSHPVVVKLRRMAEDANASPQYRAALSFAAREFERWEAEQ